MEKDRGRYRERLRQRQRQREKILFANDFESTYLLLISSLNAEFENFKYYRSKEESFLFVVTSSVCVINLEMRCEKTFSAWETPMRWKNSAVDLDDLIGYKKHPSINPSIYLKSWIYEEIVSIW